jgi:hypothetical protein
MHVFAGPVGDGTVTIELFWPDAEMGYRVIERAQQAFLEARQVAETSAITESITILERYSAALHSDVNRTLTELDRAQATEKGPQVARTRSVARRQATVATPDLAVTDGGVDALAPDPEVMRLKNQLTEKRGELARVEQERQRTLTDLQQKLSALQTVYTASHPSVVTMQQNLAAYQHESPQLVALRTAVEQLENKYDELAAADADRLIQAQTGRRPTAAPALTATVPAEVPLVDPAPAPSRPSQASQFASLRLRTELGQLQSILERTDGARIELAVSEAAFKYRYTVITPAQIPRDPAFPNLRLILMSGLLAGFLLAVGMAVGSDMMSNRILEPWQVERQLGLPILGTVRVV